MDFTMKKIITFLFGAFILFPAAADDISYIEEWNAYEFTQAEREELYSFFKDSPRVKYDFKPWFLAKEIVKICNQAREGMLKVYYSPVQYTEAIDSYNRQLEKFATLADAGGMDRPMIGAFEIVILNSREYTYQKSLINSMSFNEGYKECNKWRGALLATEYGL